MVAFLPVPQMLSNRILILQVEVERKVLCQSAFAAEKSTPRKDRCVHRDDSMLAICQSGVINTQGTLILIFIIKMYIKL